MPADHLNYVHCARQPHLDFLIRLIGTPLSYPLLHADLQRFDGPWFRQQALVMASASAVLGPLCDGQHSSHDVLHYIDPARLAFGGLQLETCW